MTGCSSHHARTDLATRIGAGGRAWIWSIYIARLLIRFDMQMCEPSLVRQTSMRMQTSSGWLRTVEMGEEIRSYVWARWLCDIRTGNAPIPERTRTGFIALHKRCLSVGPVLGHPSVRYGNSVGLGSRQRIHLSFYWARNMVDQRRKTPRCTGGRRNALADHQTNSAIRSHHLTRLRP